MATIINAVSGTGLTQSADASGQIKIQSNGVTTNALAWGRFTFNGATMVLSAAYNISSITRSSAGIYVVNFTNSLADANYASNCWAYYSTTYIGYLAYEYSTRTSAGFTLAVNSTSSVAADPAALNVIVFGN